MNVLQSTTRCASSAEDIEMERILALSGARSVAAALREAQLA